MFSNKTIRIGNSEVVLYHDSKNNLIGIISGNVGDIHCDVNGSILGKVHKNVRGVGGNVLGGIGGYVKDGIKGHVGGDVLRVDGNVLEDVKGRVLGMVVGGVGSDYNQQIENKTGDNMKDEGSFLETVLDGITDGHKDETVDGVNDSTKNEIENDNKNETGDKMEQGESEVKMNELGSLQYMYERMQQIRQGKRDGYVNKLDEALDSFEAIMLAEEQLYEAVHNCKDGTETHKSTGTHKHTETDKVTDTVTPEKGKKKDGLKEEDGGKKAKHDLEYENKPVTTLPADEKDTTAGGDKHIPTFEDMFSYKFGRSQPEVTNKSRQDLDAEEIATINALIDKVEDAEKDGDVVTNGAQLVDKQQLQKLYGGMLRTQLEGSEKYNPCIIKYQDTFPVHAFIVAVNMASETVRGIEYRFGTPQRKLSSVYREMHALKHTYGSDEWDTCIKAYKDTFPIAGEDYAFKQETNFYLKRTK